MVDRSKQSWGDQRIGPEVESALWSGAKLRDTKNARQVWSCACAWARHAFHSLAKTTQSTTEKKGVEGEIMVESNDQ